MSGCSVIRKESVSDNKYSVESAGKSFLENMEVQNLTSKNFFITKAEIEYSTGRESQKFLANIKFNVPDRYLISLRSKTGIEAARIYITSDTVLVNDRINRSLYFGDPEALSDRFGVSAKILPLLFGDFIRGNIKSDKQILCSDGKAELGCGIDRLLINYIIDCNRMKILSALQETSFNMNSAKLEYGAFIKAGSGWIPSEINLNYNETRVLIKIVRIETPWDGIIEFIPGSRYDLIELL
jgi:hypothetical protein